MYDFYLFDVRFQTNKVIKQSLKNGGLLVTRALARRDRARQNKRIVPRQTRAAGSGGRASVVNEFVAGPPRSPTDAEKSFHLADRSSDHAVRLAGQKLVL